MRVNANDPAIRYWEWEVWLNGAKLTECFAADSARGWAKCYVSGSPMLDSDACDEVVMFGTVTLRRIERTA